MNPSSAEQIISQKQLAVTLNKVLQKNLLENKIDRVIEIEMAMDAPVDESTLVWESFVSVSKGLDESKRSQLNEFWASISSNAPKPRRPNDATLNQLQDLLTEATRLSFQK